MKMRQRSFHSGQLHSWLVVSLSLLLIVGEPAILRAGPCEQGCENTKVAALKACDTAFQTNEKLCVTDTETAQTICIDNKTTAFAKAQVDRDSSFYAAEAGYLVASSACLYMLNPACLVTLTAGYLGTLGAIHLSYASKLAVAEIEGKNCTKSWKTAFDGCRKKADIARDGCVKIAIDANAACHKKCGGNHGGNDGGG